MNRQAQQQQWLHGRFPAGYTCTPLAGDASFRCYSRLSLADGSTYILMDAPPPQEDVRPFVHLAGVLRDAGVRTPTIFAEDLSQGFLLLEDFGDETWAKALQRGADVEPLLADALRQLHALQAIASSTGENWGVFDAPRMRRECALWTDWFLPLVVECTLTSTQRAQVLHALTTFFSPLSTIPQAVLHLDYHSRNLMLPGNGLPLGVIDFQDALLGPISYDLASLLYDCYQDYPESLRQDWSYRFFHQLPSSWQASFDCDPSQWHRLLRMTAMQRHLKAIGIFARLAYRDGKRNFLQEIPLTQKHLRQELSLFADELPKFVLDLLKHTSCV